MKELPLSIVLSALIKDNKILLIKRTKGDYVGLWSLPGGKIEKNEHFSQAATREMREESGLECKFEKYCGLVSEHLAEGGKNIQHFLLHVCMLSSDKVEVVESSEGGLEWFDLDDIEKMKNKITPSDFLMIQKMIIRGEGNYYDCVIEKISDDHVLRKFE